MEKVRLTEKEIVAEPERLFQRESFAKFKGMGLSDKYLAYLSNKGQSEIFQFRADHQLFPAYKAVDTCAGEFEARTPYFYSTYTAKQNEAHALSKENSVVILGSGPNRIGQGIEFDYSCVKACGFFKRSANAGDNDQLQPRNGVHRLRQFRPPVPLTPLFGGCL